MRFKKVMIEIPLRLHQEIKQKAAQHRRLVSGEYENLLWDALHPKTKLKRNNYART